MKHKPDWLKMMFKSLKSMFMFGWFACVCCVVWLFQLPSKMGKK